MRVVVVGAGIGGLTTAAMPARNGVSVDVLRRRPGLPERGTALGMWPEAVRALDRLDRGDELRRLAFPQTQGRIRRRDGAPLFRIEVPEPTYLISRPQLLRLLYRALPSGSAGHVARWAVDDRGELGTGGTVGPDSARGRPQQLVRVRAPRSRQGSAGRRLLEEVYGTGTGRCARQWPGVTSGQAEGEPVLVHELAQSPRLRTYVTGRVALVGDAAHTMAPNLGRGACEAILDGVALGQSLLHQGSAGAGLRAYDHARRRRSQRIVRGARLMSRVGLARRGTAPAMPHCAPCLGWLLGVGPPPSRAPRTSARGPRVERRGVR